MNHTDYQLQKPMTIKDIITVLWYRKWTLIILTLSGMVISLVAGVIVNAGASKVSTIVELQWNGIVSGQYPDGKLVDYSNLFESYVFSAALTETGIEDISTNKLRNAVNVSPIVPNDILELIENELRRGNKLSYFATEYKITLKYGSLGLSFDEGQLLLNTIIDEFRSDFETKYIQGTVLTNYLINDYSSYDYLEALNMLKSQIEMINNAVSINLPEGSKFVSTQSGMSFNDIRVRTNLINMTSVSSIASRINTYLLTKDKPLLINMLTYENEIKQVELDKKNDIKSNLESLIANYTGSTVSIIIPGMDPSQVIKVDSYLNSLYEELVDQNEQIAELTNDIAYNQVIINRLNGNDPLYVIDDITRAEQSAVVDSTVSLTSAQLKTVTDDLDLILKEYQEFRNRLLIKPIVSPQHESNVSYILFLAVGTIIGGVTGLLVVFILDANQKSKALKKDS